MKNAPTPKTTNATRKAKARKANTVPVTVGLTSKQAEIVRDHAKQLRATPGDFIAACAMAHLGTMSGSEDKLLSLHSALYSYVACGDAPPDEGLPFMAGV